MRLPKRLNFFKGMIALALVSLACGNFSTSASEPEYRYDDLPAPGNESAAFSEYRAIAQWNKFEIAYVFVNGTSALSGNEEQDVVRQAFAMWARSTPLTFTEVAGSSQADIVIGWAEGEHGDGDPFDGSGDVLAHASFPNPYEDRQVFLHFDDAERWVNSDSRNVDLLTVAAHEIGHTWGWVTATIPTR